MATYVLDASALINLLMNTPGADQIAELVRDSNRLGSPLLVSVSNWGKSSIFRGSAMENKPRVKHCRIFRGYPSGLCPWICLRRSKPEK